MTKTITCEGCLEEIGYGLQLLEEGLTVGLEEAKHGHYFVFAFDKKGKMIVF